MVKNPQTDFVALGVGCQFHGTGRLQVLGLGQDAHNDQKQLSLCGVGPFRHSGVMVGALGKKVRPVNGGQTRLRAVAGVFFCKVFSTSMARCQATGSG